MSPPEPRRNIVQRVPTPPPAPAKYDPNFYRVNGRVPVALLAQRAISAEDAVAFTAKPEDARAFARLRAAGIVIEAAPRKFYIDLVRYHAAAEARRKLWPVVVVAAIFVAFAATYFYRAAS